MMMESIDDMALARATAEANGYHERSPSMMMIVVPLQDDSEQDALYCDDLNASYYEFFGQEDDDQAELDDQPVPRRRLDVGSPKSVLDIEPFPMAGRYPSKNDVSGLIPALTDLMSSHSTSITSARRSGHRRSRNQAKIDFKDSVLPYLDEALKEYDGSEKAGAMVPPLIKDRIMEPEVPPTSEIEAEC